VISEAEGEVFPPSTNNKYAAKYFIFF
jgi:hypothetical protein